MHFRARAFFPLLKIIKLSSDDRSINSEFSTQTVFQKNSSTSRHNSQELIRIPQRGGGKLKRKILQPRYDNKGRKTKLYQHDERIIIEFTTFWTMPHKKKLRRNDGAVKQKFSTKYEEEKEKNREAENYTR